MALAPVVKEITIETSAARAFRVFTEDIGAWWPLATHHIGPQPAETAVIEPRAGGRWFERAADGSECPWGRVLVWDPPARLVLSWQIGGEWKYDKALASEVELRFVVRAPRSRALSSNTASSMCSARQPKICARHSNPKAAGRES